MNKTIEGSIYPIFDNRYNVVIGSRGKVSVISNLAHNKVMKVYGKKKDNLRFVNLTISKGAGIQSFKLSDLKGFALSEVDDIKPITEEEILYILDSVKPPKLLDSPLLIDSLPCDKDHYGNISYREELEGFNRFYSKVTFNNTSNGFINYNYKVSTYCTESKITTNSSTEVFTDYNTIHIHSVRDLDNDTRLQIIKLLGVNEHEE